MSSTSTNTLTFEVPDMTCSHCEAAVKLQVDGVAGVEDVVVNLDTKIVVVTGVGLDRDEIVTAIDEAGFDVA